MNIELLHFDSLQLLVQTVPRTMYLAMTLFSGIYSFHEFSVLLSVKRSGLLLRY